MKKLLAGVVVLLAVTCAVGAQEDATKQDLKNMQGTWAVKSVEKDGQKIPDDQVKGFNLKLEVKGDKYTIHFGDTQAGAGSLKVDAAKKPKQIDIVITEGMGKGETLKAIYKFEGETMIVCANEPGTEGRPTEFKTKEGGNQMLFVYQRVKK